MYILKILIFLQLLFLITSNENINPSPRTGPQDLLVTHYDCEENEQKTLHKYAINQVSQCETEPQAIETTNVIATLYSKARATTVIGYKFTATFSEKKVHCSQVSNGNKNRLDHESFYQSNIERLLHLNPEDCKNELLRLNITRNKNTDRKLVYFQVFADSVHQAELERYQGHIKLDEKYPYNGAHGRLTYDIHDKHWIPHIGINDPSNCKADTKNKGYQEIMFFDWKIQLEKIQLTRDLSDNTMIYQGIRLPCKNDQGYCDPTTRTQATIVWFPEDTCTTFQVAKIHARMIKFHEKYFIQSIPYEQVHPSRRQSSNFRNIHNIENKLTRFQIYQETELACKYRNPLHKTQYSEILVEYEKGFDMTTGKVKIDPYATSHPINEGTSYIPVDFQKSKSQPGGHLKPHNTRSTRLQELSLMNSTYFGNIHYDIHLDMKLDYTISRIFQEMSLSELETLHQLCELERTQILQSLALAVLKIPYAGYLLSGNRSNFLDYEGNILWFYTCTKKVSPLYVFEDKRCYKRIPIFYKNKVHFVDTLSRRTYFWDTAVPCGSENSHNVVQLNPDEDKYYLLTPYPTLMQSLKKFSPESIRAIARNPNIDLQSIGIYSKSDIQHHIRTQQFQELLTQMDTIQRQSIDQNLRKLAETAGFADIYTQDYSGYFKDIKDYIYLNGEKYRPQDISPINIFSFVTLKNEILDFLGWPYYILEKLTILYAMFNFIGFLFSLLKGIYNTCAIHTQVNRQASVARILFAGFFGIFSSSINKILLDAQIKEYNTKIATRQNTYDEEHNNVDITPTAPQLPPLPHNHPLSHRQFTYIGYKKSLKTYTAPRANEYTLEYYDHNIIRTNQDQFLDDDRFANPQITEKFFIKTPYVFTLNIFYRKFDHIISEALTDTKAYESFKEKFQLFSLTFHFLAPHERDLHCSHDIMLRTKQTHTYTYYRFIQNHFDLHAPSRQPHHRFQFINSKYFTYCIKDTNLHSILRNYDPITQMYIFCPITKTFNAEESRPFLIPHEFVQPIEIPILEFIHNTKYNHKLYNLIQNTPYDFAVGTEELKTIKALQLLWPLLQTKNIIRILAKLLTNCDIIHDIFPHGFFPDD